ncbi:MAG: HAMP domain-containing histidine kinase [Lachnospiraceae bacterium]|nr:HAMP domain-containing histidine kinase [Lachnospiraceae bacterium]
MKKNKKEREAKGKEEKWYYTTRGKRFRGFLCMITFAVFLASVEFAFLAWSYFGENIFQSNSKDYHETKHYSDDVATEYSSLLATISEIENGKTSDKLRIIDTSWNEISDYDLQSLKDDNIEGELPNNLEGIEEYEVMGTEIPKNTIYSYPGLLRTLEIESEKGSYLYFSKQSFKDLFVHYGRLNTNHKYSPYFSEKAYFVFDTKSVVCDVGTGDVEFETYDSVNDTLTTYNSLNDMIADGGEYAVYDPVEDVYYSTADDYFEPYDSYLYDCGEVLLALDKHTDDERDRLDNIVLPLLWSENMSIYSVLKAKTGSVNEGETAVVELESMEKGAFVYFIACRNFTYTNVDSIEEITSLPYSYCVEQGLRNYAAQKAQKTVESLDMDDYFEELLEAYFVGEPMVVCFGMDYDRAAANADKLDLPLRNSSVHYQMYNEATAYIVPMLVLAILSFILLIVQAVSLILTTGRKGKKNVELGTNMEIELNAYDNLSTEVWLFVTMLVMVICTVAAIAGLKIYADPRYFYMSIIGHILLSVVFIIPFGFFFMEFTLSFARRVKAKNLRSHHCFAKVFRWCWTRILDFYRKCTHFYYKKNGIKRLWILFLVYLGLLFVCVLQLVLLGVYGISGHRMLSAVLLLLVIISALHIGVVIIIYRVCRDVKQLIQCVDDITKGELDSKCELSTRNSFFTELADGINHIGDGLKAAVETSLKDERMKTELITNVSHDLKTPITSIINYVDLLKKEEMQSEDARHYLEVLDAKSQRLKQLTEDLVEAAKANSGSIELTCMPLAFDELMRQAIGEFEDKFAKRDLNLVAAYPEQPAVIMADGRRLFRILENVLQNAYKYALEGTRIYADLSNHMGEVVFTLKNVSAAQLNISPEELMERFTRGDSSRTTEGSGLGLSIAKDLTRLMEGTFEIQLDGDLFKAIVRFPEYNKKE